MVDTDYVPVKRRIGFFSGVALIVGNIIGWGIFVAPKGVLLNAGSVGLTLVIWLLCGIIALGAALVYAELGLLIPKSGGDFHYLLEVFGTFPAFMFAWCQYLLMPAGNVVLGLTFAEYMCKIIFDDCGPSDLIKKMLASAVLLSTGIINCLSVRLVAKAQLLFTGLKLAGLLLIIIGGLIRISKGVSGSLTSGFEGTAISPTSIALAFYSGLFTYSGWVVLNTVVEELENPRRNLPLCIITSMILITLFYVLINVAYLSAMTKDEFLSSWAVAATWAELEMKSVAVLIPVIVDCSIYGSLTGNMFIAGRVPFAAARAGVFPEVLSYLNVNNNIPLPATLLTIALSYVLIIPADIGIVLNMLSFILWLICGINMLSHIILRFRMKKDDIPFKVPIIIPILVLLICIYLVVAPFLEPVRAEFWYAIGYLTLGVMLYIPFVFFKMRLPGLDHVSKCWQLLLNVAPPSQFND